MGKMASGDERQVASGEQQTDGETEDKTEDKTQVKARNRAQGDGNRRQCRQGRPRSEAAG